MAQVNVALVGAGFIVTDHLYDPQRSEVVEVPWVEGIEPASDEAGHPKDPGSEASHDGVESRLAQGGLPRLDFEGTSDVARITDAAEDELRQVAEECHRTLLHCYRDSRALEHAEGRAQRNGVSAADNLSRTAARRLGGRGNQLTGLATEPREEALA